MSIGDVIEKRGIEELLHFTTEKGLTGVCATNEVKPRRQLEDSDHLEHIFSPNANVRRDEDWTDHVSFSINIINHQFFSISSEWESNKEHWWCILSFDPNIIKHDGVVFCTTNNIWTGVSRQKGEEGLKSMYSKKILTQENKHGIGNHQYAIRTPDHPPDLPTSLQAEVLYPGEVSIEYLERVYCRKPDQASRAAAIIETFDLEEDIDVRVEPERFTE